MPASVVYTKTNISDVTPPQRVIIEHTTHWKYKYPQQPAVAFKTLKAGELHVEMLFQSMLNSSNATKGAEREIQGYIHIITIQNENDLLLAPNQK